MFLESPIIPFIFVLYVAHVIVHQIKCYPCKGNFSKEFEEANLIFIPFLIAFTGSQNFDVIRFATYRASCKLRFIQKRCNCKYSHLWPQWSSLTLTLQRSVLVKRPHINHMYDWIIFQASHLGSCAKIVSLGWKLVELSRKA